MTPTSSGFAATSRRRSRSTARAWGTSRRSYSKQSAERSRSLSREQKKLVLCIIDGLTPAVLEQGIAEGRLPALAFLAARGAYARGVSTFPSVTPVCLSAIATGAGPDVHGIPHLVWYHREERRLVEYGSSLGAVLAAGVRGVVRDSVVEMSGTHLSREATTVFEALEDAGLGTGAANFTC